MDTHYITYITTRLSNGQVYGGQHVTKNLDDGYIGSGKRLHYCIAKDGREGFSREIVGHYENQEQLDAAEKELVARLRELGPERCLNLKDGGTGGWDHCRFKGPDNPLYGKSMTDLIRNKRGEEGVASYKANIASSLTGKAKSAEHRRNLSKAKKAYLAGLSEHERRERTEQMTAACRGKNWFHDPVTGKACRVENEAAAVAKLGVPVTPGRPSPAAATLEKQRASMLEARSKKFWSSRKV